jgi:hypothetical protein
MNHYKRTKGIYVRVAPELLELMQLMRAADYARLMNKSDSDIFTKCVSEKALKELVWSEPEQMNRAIELAQNLCDL